MSSSIADRGMSPVRFIDLMQNYFGERYHPDAAVAIASYLAGYDELWIKAFAKVAMLRHPRQYKSAPGVAELERFVDDARALRTRLLQDLTVPALAYREELSDEERAELGRMMDEARETPVGRLLLGVVGRES